MNQQKAFVEIDSIFHNKSAVFVPDDDPTQFAINEVLRILKIPLPTHPAQGSDPLEQTLNITGAMKKTVDLSGDFRKTLAVPVLAEVDEMTTVLRPTLRGRLQYFDFTTRKYQRLTQKNRVSAQGIEIYKPLPDAKSGVRSLFRFVKEAVDKRGLFGILVLELFVILLGLILPFVNKQIFETVIPSGMQGDILPIAVLMFSVIVGISMLSLVKSSLSGAFINRLNAQFQGAILIKLLNLPINFYKDHKSGDLSARITEFGDLTKILTSGAISALTGGVFSFVYLIQIFSFAPALFMPTTIILAVLLILLFFETAATLKWQKQYVEKSTHTSGILFEMFAGIAKIKLTAAENRAFYRWSVAYSDVSKIRYRPPFMVQYSSVLYKVAFLLGTVFIFISASLGNISPSSYIAFGVSYGVIVSAVLELDRAFFAFVVGKVAYKMLKPVLDAPTEQTEAKTSVDLQGNLSVNHLRFQYGETPVINGISFSIRKGEYVALVGSSGCGKSTLVRLLLGFERPLTGAIYYDDTDMKDISMQSLRRQIGVVMQNGKLFSGDIFSNITISAPNATQDDVWEIATRAGLREDIEAMPMGMYTLLSEGGGGLSGGQKQKLMIARAIAQQPKLLIFDEATSALDNITQEIVSKSVAQLDCTRIVIAHRLSTIVDCDRILVMDKGRIVQMGTFSELMKETGLFRELAQRQLINAE